MEFTSSWNTISEVDLETLKQALYCGNLPALKLTSDNIFNIATLVAKQEYLRNVIGIECNDKLDQAVPQFFSIMKHLTNLRYLRHYGRCFGFVGTKAFSDCLCKLKSLHNLTILDYSLSKNILSAETYFELSSLDLSTCNIGSDGVALLCSHRNLWVNLYSLNLSHNQLGSDDAEVLGKVLLQCEKLCFLNLYSNNIGDTGAAAIAEGLRNHTTLLELRLGNNNFELSGITELNHVIISNHQLQHLDLSRCHMSSESVADVVEVMSGDSLQTLNLNCNELNIEGITNLCFGLTVYTQLVELDVGFNNIESLGVTYLAEGLTYCILLEVLNLKGNNITF